MVGFVPLPTLRVLEFYIYWLANNPVPDIKDMVIDPPITVKLSLTEEELRRIQKKMMEIRFFDYPTKFSPPKRRVHSPYETYYFKVKYGYRVKELLWEDKYSATNRKAKRLRELIKLIKKIIWSKGELKKLPTPRGLYA